MSGNAMRSRTVNDSSSGGVEMLTVSAVAQSQFGNQDGDWTQLPDACRLLVARLMDRATRSAWAAVCQLTRQDVHADTSVLAWAGCGQWQMHQAPLPKTSTDDLSFTTTLPAGLHARLPYLKHLNCSGMPQLTSIHGVPSTLRSLDLSFCHHLDDVAALQHCTALEQLILTGFLGFREGLAATLPPAMAAISPHLRRLKLHVFDWASDAVAEAVVCSLETLTGLQELSLYMEPDNRDTSLHEMIARAIACMADLRVLALTNGDGYGGDPVTRFSFNELVLAIARLTSLQTLNLSGIEMHSQSAGATEALAQSLSSMPATLTRLNLTGAEIDPTNLAALVPILQAHSTTLRSIGLSCTVYGLEENYPLDADGLADLLPGLRCCSALTDVNLADSYLLDGGAVLAAALEGCAPRLTSLDLCGNRLADEGAACLATVLSRMTALGKLGLRDNALGPAGAASLATALSSSAPPLTSLDLSRNGLGSEGATALAPALSSIAHSLTSLNLSGNRISCEGAAALAPAVQSMTALISFDCAGNDMAQAGAAALAPALLSIARPSLTSLDIANNSITCRGARLLAPALSRMTALVALVYRGNGLGPAGARVLAPALSSIAPSLTSLDLCNNMLEEEDAAALAPALSCMTALATLFTSDNSLGFAGASALVPALLSIAPSLKSLNLSNNAMTASSIVALAPAMRNMTALTHLSFSKNIVDLTGAATLASVLPAMIHLKHLALGSSRLGLDSLRVLAQGLQTLSGQQRWRIGYPSRLLKGDHRKELCHPDDTAELAAIIDGLSFVRQWEVCYDHHDLGPQYDALKVLGVTVDL